MSAYNAIDSQHSPPLISDAIQQTEAIHKSCRPPGAMVLVLLTPWITRLFEKRCSNGCGNDKRGWLSHRSAHACASKLDWKLVARRFVFGFGHRLGQVWGVSHCAPPLRSAPQLYRWFCFDLELVSGTAQLSQICSKVLHTPKKPLPWENQTSMALCFFFQDDSLLLYSKTSSSYHHLVMLYKNSYLFSIFRCFLFYSC